MIQLPSNIRTTLFSIALDGEPQQIFSHEDDRLFVSLYMTYNTGQYPMIGRTKTDALNSDGIFLNGTPVVVYGPEQLWVALGQHGSPIGLGIVVFQGVYRA